MEKVRCRICGSLGETRHLPIYVSGSEGLEICHQCEMSLVEYLRQMIHASVRARNAFAKSYKAITRQD